LTLGGEGAMGPSAPEGGKKKKNLKPEKVQMQKKKTSHKEQEKKNDLGAGGRRSTLKPGKPDHRKGGPQREKGEGRGKIHGHQTGPLPEKENPLFSTEEKRSRTDGKKGAQSPAQKKLAEQCD